MKEIVDKEWKEVEQSLRKILSKNKDIRQDAIEPVMEIAKIGFEMGFKEGYDYIFSVIKKTFILNKDNISYQ